jgi:hypothetical protein
VRGFQRVVFLVSCRVLVLVIGGVAPWGVEEVVGLYRQGSLSW